MKVIFGIFLVLHGLVHLLYFGQSRRLYELGPGMAWPDGAWMLSGLMKEKTLRGVASIALVIAALVFVAAGAGLLLSQSWWTTLRRMSWTRIRTIEAYDPPATRSSGK